jgi:hypothetical protein
MVIREAEEACALAFMCRSRMKIDPVPGTILESQFANANTPVDTPGTRSSFYPDIDERGFGA